MAWRSSGKSNAELIENLAQNGIFHSPRVQQAMAKVDRANYVRDKRDAYEDSPQSIGHGATISAPHMHAYAAEHLLPYLKPGSRCLDVGSGSGYLSAVLYHLVASEDRTGKIVGIEHVSELAEWSLQNLRRDGLKKAVEDRHIEMLAGDGRKGPFDAIHVGAAAPTLPEALVDQLASPGRMFIPIGNFEQYIYHIDKDKDGNVTKTQVMGVRYVPLTDRDKQATF